MSCRAEMVTGYLDGALDAADSGRVTEHLESCAACRGQLEGERSLRARLRALPAPEPRPGFEMELRAGLRRSRGRRRLRVLLPLAAGLMALGVWLRGSPEAIARALAFDHAKCFRKEQLPAKVFGNDAAAIASWFEAQGTPMPIVPAEAAGLRLEGARYCPLLDGTSVAHLYYRAGSRHASLFVIPRGLRMGASSSTTTLGREVRLLRHGDQTLGVAGEAAADVLALSAALVRRSASLTVAPATP